MCVCLSDGICVCAWPVFYAISTKIIIIYYICIYMGTYVTCLSIDCSVCLSIYLSIDLSNLSSYLSIYLI